MAQQTRQKITPEITVNGASDACDYYVKHMGAKIIAKYPTPDGRLMHAEIEMPNGAKVYLKDDFWEGGRSELNKDGKPYSSVALSLYFETYEKGKLFWDKFHNLENILNIKDVMNFEPQFWGENYGRVLCKYGHCWSLSSPLDSNQIAASNPFVKCDNNKRNAMNKSNKELEEKEMENINSQLTGQKRCLTIDDYDLEMNDKECKNDNWRNNNEIDNNCNDDFNDNDEPPRKRIKLDASNAKKANINENQSKNKSNINETELEAPFMQRIFKQASNMYGLLTGNKEKENEKEKEKEKENEIQDMDIISVKSQSCGSNNENQSEIDDNLQVAMKESLNLLEKEKSESKQYDFEFAMAIHNSLNNNEKKKEQIYSASCIICDATVRAKKDITNLPICPSCLGINQL